MLGLEEGGGAGLEPTWREWARPLGLGHHHWACRWQPHHPPPAAPFSIACFHAVAHPRMGMPDQVGFRPASTVVESFSPDLKLNYHPQRCGCPPPVPLGARGPCGPGQPKHRGGCVPFCSSGWGTVGRCPWDFSLNTESHLSTPVLFSLVLWSLKNIEFYQ